jgi:RND family efflux transporter MFP subunit
MTLPLQSNAARLAVLLVGLAHLGCSSASDPAAPPGAAVAVSTQTLTTVDRPAVVEIGGSVQARTTAVLTSRIVAPIAEIRVAPGDRVRAGDVLVVLDSRDLAGSARRANALVGAARRSLEAAAADERAAQTALRLARATHSRIATLAAKRSATPQELDEAAAGLAAAEARVAAAGARVLEASSGLESAEAASDTAGVTESFTRIAAPFDGLITEKRLEAGNTTMPGTPLVVLEDTRSFRLDVRLDVSRVRDIATGVSIPVTIDGAPSASDASLDGIVSEVARAVDSGTHTVVVKIGLPERPWLRAGLFGRARFSGTSRPVLIVPPAAVVRRGQIATVFTVENEVARLRMVNVAGDEVISGLSRGEVVITNPPADLIDGRRVRVGGR